MSLARDLDDFIRTTGQDVFIEAEGKPRDILRFIEDYNSRYSPIISVHADGIIKLQDDADKRALELRLYLEEKEGAPLELRIARNTHYRVEYSYRINNNALIRELFELGYRIGIN